jgi:hypothetical protein
MVPVTNLLLLVSSRMVRRLLLSVQLTASIAVAAACGLIGLAAWADAQHVCPGVQCDDARAVVAIGLLMVPTSVVTGIVAVRMLLRS